MRLFTWLLCGSGAFATTPPTTHTVHEKRQGAADVWDKQSRAQQDVILPIRIALKQQNLDNGERYLLDISDPDSPNFGKHWTAEKIANTFAPSKESTDITLEWLQVAGINIKRINYSAGRNWLEFSATIAEAERLFDAQYHIFKNKENGRLRIACDEYGLPQHVREHVDFVMPTVQLDGLRPVGQFGLLKSSPPSYLDLTDLSHCKSIMTINCLRALYGMPAGKYNHSGNQLGIPQWWESLSAADLKQFHERFTDPKIPSDVFPELVRIGGDEDDSNDTATPPAGGSESALDVQTAYSIIWPQQVRLYSVGESASMESTGSFNVLLDALDASYCTYQGGNQPYMDPSYPSPKDGGYVGPLQCGGAPMSNVLSVSYGLVEGELPRFYQERQCHEWMKLALQGVSVIFASGDNGVANRQNACLNIEQGHLDAKGTRFAPSFPQSCPYVTVVGGTQLRDGSISGGEKAVADSMYGMSYYSGGGFSDVFARPSWQASAVSKYLSEHAPAYEKSVFNSSGRAYPDVAAMGLNMPIVLQGNDAVEGGTSVAAPIFASIITLLNEERLEAGKKPIGFLNPILYKYPDMFNDITEGKNPGCGTEGFAASAGWDAVTGHGTPRYEKMREVFLKLG